LNIIWLGGWIPAFAGIALEDKDLPFSARLRYMVGAKRGDLLMVTLIGFIVLVIDLYIWVVIAGAILSWLIAFNVVNTRNRFVYMVADVAYKITEPVLRPIRRILPSFGGIDLSPIVLILLLYFIRDLLFEYVIFA
jgi:YggT family protein